jgi:hypothetical protein
MCLTCDQIANYLEDNLEEKQSNTRRVGTLTVENDRLKGFVE